MKKIVSVLIATMLALTTLSGCNSVNTSGTENNDNASNKKRIGVVVKAMDSEHWLAVKKGVEKAAQEENVDVAVLAPDKEVNAEQQFKIIDDLIQQKVDALIIAPCDLEGIIPIIEKANEAKIPIFTVDTNASGGIVSFIGTNNVIGGKIAGERIVKILNGKGKVALITGVLEQQSHRDRAAGFKEVLKASPDIQLVSEQSGNSESAVAMSIMENILQSTPDIDAVFCTNAPMALGALEAIDSKGKSGQVKIVGFDTQTDALNSVKNGKIDSIVAQNPDDMGYKAVKNAIDYLNGKNVEKCIYTDTELISKENVDEYINNKLEKS